jgi:hypothetical protein
VGAEPDCERACELARARRQEPVRAREHGHGACVVVVIVIIRGWRKARGGDDARQGADERGDAPVRAGRARGCVVPLARPLRDWLRRARTRAPVHRRRAAAAANGKKEVSCAPCALSRKSVFEFARARSQRGDVVLDRLDLRFIRLGLSSRVRLPRLGVRGRRVRTLARGTVIRAARGALVRVVALRTRRAEPALIFALVRLGRSVRIVERLGGREELGMRGSSARSRSRRYASSSPRLSPSAPRNRARRVRVREVSAQPKRVWRTRCSSVCR